MTYSLLVATSLATALKEGEEMISTVRDIAQAISDYSMTY